MCAPAGTKSDEHAVRAGRGSAWARVFRGERQGREIGAAHSAGTQSATSLGPAYCAGCEVIPLCINSGAAIQSKEFIGVIQSGNWTKVIFHSRPLTDIQVRNRSQAWALHQGHGLNRRSLTNH